MSTSLAVVPLSQTHLTLLETCARRFQYIFEQALTVPPTPSGQAAALWGNQFHLLMQQQALGLPVQLMAEANPDMVERLEALRQQAPYLFNPAANERLRQSEHQRSIAFNGYMLTVIYDLVILTEQSGLIVDWKTYLKPPSQGRLADDWQTRLYLYVLAETSGLAPEQLTMAYWFVRHQGQPGNVLPPSDYRFNYSQRRHEQTRADLLRLTERLSTLRQSGEFPQTVNCDRCVHCPFQIRCQRMTATALPIDLDAIAEVSLD